MKNLAVILVAGLALAIVIVVMLVFGEEPTDASAPCRATRPSLSAWLVQRRV